MEEKMKFKSNEQIEEEWEKEAKENPVMAKTLIKAIDDIREIKTLKIETITITVLLSIMLTLLVINLILLLLK